MVTNIFRYQFKIFHICKTTEKHIYVTYETIKINKKKLIKNSLALAIICLVALSGVQAQSMETGTIMVGGEAMYPKKDIVDNAVNSKDHTTLITAVKAAGLVETLKGSGPFT
jgi:uncharacterized surface protein with fasciclin (FAS1) repeats